MNVGYENSNEPNLVDEVCPICGNNIYINKYGNDFFCVDSDCGLNMDASVLINKIEAILRHYSK